MDNSNSYLVQLQKLNHLLNQNLSLLLPAAQDKTDIVNNIKQVCQKISLVAANVVKNSKSFDKEKFIKSVTDQSQNETEQSNLQTGKNLTMPSGAYTIASAQKESKARKIQEMTSAAGGSAQGVAGGIDLGSDKKQEEINEEDEAEKLLRKEVKESISELYKKNRKEFNEYFDYIMSKQTIKEANNPKQNDKQQLTKYYLQGSDKVGFNFAVQTYSQIKQSIKDNIEMLENDKDRQVFSDGLIKNIDAYCQKIEQNMVSGEPVEEDIISEPKTTGEAVLVGTFNDKIRNPIEKTYRSLLTDPNQRKSFKDNLLNIIKNDQILIKRPTKKEEQPNNDLTKPNDTLSEPNDNNSDNEFPKDINL